MGQVNLLLGVGVAAVTILFVSPVCTASGGLFVGKVRYAPGAFSISD